MTRSRSFRVDRTPDIAYEAAEYPRCRATIQLDGTLYRCRRDHVDGTHDAFSYHDDGGLVRW